MGRLLHFHGGAFFILHFLYVNARPNYFFSICLFYYVVPLPPVKHRPWSNFLHSDCYRYAFNISLIRKRSLF